MVEHWERMKKKQKTIRASTVKLMTRIEAEVSKDIRDYENLREMLLLLSAKEESFGFG